MIDQIGLAICGVSSVWLSQDQREERRKWACIFGLIAQPFWFYSAYTAQQWGVLFLCFVYALGWSRGFYNHWVRKSA